MPLPIQRILPGRMEAAWQAEIDRLVERDAIGAIFSARGELWRSEPHHVEAIRNRLGWVPVLDPMRAAAAELGEFTRKVRGDGFRDVVLLGMGGSSLAPEVFSLLFPPATGKFLVLDSTDPAMVRRIERAVELRRTLFVVASKSGTTVETLSQFHYFRHRLRAAGAEKPGAHFIAITDPGSYLEQLAGEYSFRHVFRNPADIGGRYSALSYFGLVPAALVGADLKSLLDCAVKMRDACAPGSAAKTNPGLMLGALLGAAAAEGADKLALVATPPLTSLGNWIEQLVAESTGKDGRGIVPVAGEAPGAAEIFDRAVVALLSLEGEDRGELDAFLGDLTPRGVPVADIRLARPEELGAEFFRWEVATAVAGAVLGVNPFDEPNVSESKKNTEKILKKLSAGEPPPEPDFTDSGIAVHAAGVRAVRGAGTRLADALAGFFAAPAPGDYLAVLAFLDRSEEHAARLDALRRRLRDRLRLPVLAGFGPRYLHSIGQLYKGGPATGHFLMLTARPAEDAEVPEAGYSFAQLELAQALGDFEALAKRKRPVLRLELERGAAAGLEEFERAIERALAARPAGA